MTGVHLPLRLHTITTLFLMRLIFIAPLLPLAHQQKYSEMYQLHCEPKKTRYQNEFTVTFRVLKKISHAYTSINFRPSENFIEIDGIFTN